MNCPSCGASIGFRSERAPYVVCRSCDTMLLRKDIDLEAVGRVAEVQPDGSPLQVGTRGNYQGRGFEVAGRIQLRYEQGFWNEWFLILEGGEEAWLGEAMGQYFFSRVTPGPNSFRPVMPGDLFKLDDKPFAAMDYKQVGVVSFEGELPFVVQSKQYFVCDLRNSEGDALTIDYSDGEPTYYLGRMVPFEELHLTGLREGEDPAIPVPASQIRKVTCPSCGAPHELSTGPQSRLLVCSYCGAALDSSVPELKVLERYITEMEKIGALGEIPIGTIAHLEDGNYKVIGCVVQTTRVEGIVYPWTEYLLYNHLTGYRWLSESNGHYTLFSPMEGVPHYHGGALVGNPENTAVYWQGQKFLHFQTSDVKPNRVTGEFYWRLQVGERSRSVDYVSPPLMLSASVAKTDITWSLGRYLGRDELDRVFPTVSEFSKPRGIAPNQPNPYRQTRRQMIMPALVSLLLAYLMVWSGLFLPGEKTLATFGPVSVTANSAQPALRENVDVPPGSRSLKVTLKPELKDRWAHFQVNLRATGERPGWFSKLPPRSHGVYLASIGKADREGTVYFASVPSTRALLEVDVHTGPPTGIPPLAGSLSKEQERPLLTFTAEVSTVKNDPAWGGMFWFIALLGLAFYFVGARASKFETARWYESDYG